MSKYVRKSLRVAAVVCLPWASAAFGQTVGSDEDAVVLEPAPKGSDAAVNVPGETSPDAGSQTELAQCKSSLSAAVTQMVDTRDDLVAQLMQAQSEVQQCRADVRDRDNGARALLRRAEQAEDELEELKATTITEEERAAFEAQIADRDALIARNDTKITKLEARISRMLARLEESGISEVPQFSYLQNDPSGSLIEVPKLANISRTGAVPAEDCGKALDWLRNRSGEDSPFRLAAWTFNSRIQGWQLCRFNSATSEVETLIPVSSDKAHLLYFR